MLIKSSTKKTRHYFVGKVEELYDRNAVQKRFLVRLSTKVKSDYFVFREGDNFDAVSLK